MRVKSNQNPKLAPIFTVIFALAPTLRFIARIIFHICGFVVLNRAHP